MKGDTFETVFPEYASNPLGSALRRAREGLTQRELADRTGIPKRHISEMGMASAPLARSGLANLPKRCMSVTIGCFCEV